MSRWQAYITDVITLFSILNFFNFLKLENIQDWNIWPHFKLEISNYNPSYQETHKFLSMTLQNLNSLVPTLLHRPNYEHFHHHNTILTLLWHPLLTGHSTHFSDALFLSMLFPTTALFSQKCLLASQSPRHHVSIKTQFKCHLLFMGSPDSSLVSHRRTYFATGISTALITRKGYHFLGSIIFLIP